MLNPEGTSDTEGPSDSTPERKKLNPDARLTRITEIQDKAKDLSYQIGYKQKWREAANNVRNYKECDKLAEEMSQLKSQKRKLETELAKSNESQVGITIGSMEIIQIKQDKMIIRVLFGSL